MNRITSCSYHPGPFIVPTTFCGGKLFVTFSSVTSRFVRYERYPSSGSSIALYVLPSSTNLTTLTTLPPYISVAASTPERSCNPTKSFSFIFRPPFVLNSAQLPPLYPLDYSGRLPDASPPIHVCGHFPAHPPPA